MAALGLQPGQPRALSFGPGSTRNDFRLLEVDDQVLQEIIKTGAVIKGREDDEAVLVTSSHTYSMKLVETSNLQLLVGPQPSEEDVPQCSTLTASVDATLGYGRGLMTQWDHFRSAARQGPVTVDATSCSHIELVKVAPRLEGLRGLLWQRPYGIEDEREAGADADMAEADCGTRAAGYTFDELLERVQASPAELRGALAAEGAMELDGRWRAVDPNYLGSVLELVLLTAEQEGMPVAELREHRLAVALQPDGVHPAVVRHCLKTYGEPRPQDGAKAEMDTSASDGSSDGSSVWRLDEEKVCVHFATKVLASHNKLLSEFNSEWARAVPYGMTPSLDMLRSEALIDGCGAEARITAYPLSALPRDPAERFAALFQRRPRWEWTQLEPYLAGLQMPGQSAEALLMRFARASQTTPDAPLMYSAR